MNHFAPKVCFLMMLLILNTILQASGKGELIPFDWERIFIGDQPLWFLAEIAFRTLVIYAYSIFLIRYISSRAISQLSILEFFLVIALGSAVGDPMFYPEVPLLHCMVVITLVIALNRLLIWLINRNETAETAIEGYPMQIVAKGRIDPSELSKAHLNREKLFEYLRVKGVRQLGEVEYVFREQSGQLSVFFFDKEKVLEGLSVIPPWDIADPPIFKQGEKPDQPKKLGCTTCGAVASFEMDEVLPKCSVCGNGEWVDNVVGPEGPK